MINSDRVIPTLKDHILVDGFHHVVDLEKSLGSWMYDSATGRKYLDCFGQFASLPLGYNHPSLVKQKQRLADATLCKVVNSDLYSTEYAEFVDTLFKKALPQYFKYAFFIEGGSAAVENCLKIAFDWKAKKLGMQDWISHKLDVVHFHEAFHGRGGYTLSLTNTGKLKTQYFPKFKWTRVINPKIHFPMDENKINRLETVSLREIKAALERKLVAAIIIEPIQGEGGNNMFRKEFFQELKTLADRYDVLLIFDEVQTGFGASGKWWCHEHYGIEPDLMAFGKKSQVCGVAAKADKLDTIPDHCFKQSGRINSTWGGNLVDMVRCKLIIDIIEDEKLIDQTKEVGHYFKSELQKVENDFVVVTNVRGLGTLLAFDLPNPRARDNMLKKLRKNMVILPCGDRSIRFRPALTFSTGDVDKAIHFIRKVLE